jgi:hypothetical protein
MEQAAPAQSRQPSSLNRRRKIKCEFFTACSDEKFQKTPATQH